MKDFIEQLINQDGSVAFGDELPKNLQIAAIALLVQSAKVDNAISADEYEIILRTAAKEFQLEDTFAAELIEVGEYLIKSGKTLEDIAAKLSQTLTTAQKQHLLAIAAKVAKADGMVKAEEKGILASMAKALGVV
jgi:uncharacterized tellurite resistance protein B-like protein